MRVIAGSAKGLHLKAPKTDLRPLSDQAKEGLFNILAPKIGGVLFLDCFAGSGAVGIEALSRGAERTIFVEKDRRAVAVIRENLKTCGFTEKAQVYALDVLKALKILSDETTHFDLIYLGAPYDHPVLERALESLAQAAGQGLLLRPDGSIIAEHRKKHLLADDFGTIKKVNQRTYGDTAFSFYQRA